MKSKTLISKQTKKKTNSTLVNTIKQAKKNEGWMEVAGLLSKSRRSRMSANVGELSQGAKDNESIVVSGKVLSQGEVDKKFKVIALNFSQIAKEKLLNAGCQVLTIDEAIKSNPEAKDVKILRK